MQEQALLSVAHRPVMPDTVPNPYPTFRYLIRRNPSMPLRYCLCPYGIAYAPTVLPYCL